MPSRRELIGSGAALLAGAAMDTATSGASAKSSRLPRSVAETVRLVRSGAVSAREMVAEAIARIERINPRCNAVVAKRFDQALREAERVDRALPLAGVPILLKDVAMAGEPFYNGNRRYAEVDWRFDHTDLLTQRLLDAGAIVVGFTNVPEFTSAATTESRLYGPCRNPWNLDHSTGGSSGGAGAAVAAGMVPVAQSSDGGGSSRIPASANGLFTIKPSRGRVPLYPGNAAWLDITSSKGVLTHSVGDFALMLDLIHGVPPGETVGAPPPARPYASELSGRLLPLRIGWTTTASGSSDCHPEAKAAVAKAARLLAALGHHVREAAPTPFQSGESFEIIMAYWPSKVANRTAAIEKRLGRKFTPDDVEPDTWAMIEVSRRQSAYDFALGLDRIRDFTLRSLSWWQDYDLLLTPTTGSPPPRIGVMPAGDKPGRAASAMWGKFAPYANITGQPAASLPLHQTADGLPLGVQLVAAHWREDLLLQVSAQLEQAAPWRDRVPPLA